LSIANCGLLIQ